LIRHPAGETARKCHQKAKRKIANTMTIKNMLPTTIMDSRLIEFTPCGAPFLTSNFFPKRQCARVRAIRRRDIITGLEIGKMASLVSALDSEQG